VSIFGLTPRERFVIPTGPDENLVELIGIEPTTYGLQSRRSPN
jgi:hypothetical protein